MTRRVTDSAAVTEFRQVATDFCRVIDARHDYEVATFLQRVQPLLASLVTTAFALPELDVEGLLPQEPDRYPKWEDLFASLRAYLGEYDVFWEVYDPYTRDDPIQGSLADCISDVYLDVRHGLSLWDGASATTRREIVWQWRFDFEIHGSHHITDAMRAINALLFEHHITDPEDMTGSVNSGGQSPR